MSAQKGKARARRATPLAAEPRLERRATPGALPAVFVFADFEARIVYSAARRLFVPSASFASEKALRAEPLYAFFVRSEQFPYVEFANVLELLAELDSQPILAAMLAGFTAAVS